MEYDLFIRNLQRRFEFIIYQHVKPVDGEWMPLISNEEEIKLIKTSYRLTIFNCSKELLNQIHSKIHTVCGIEIGNILIHESIVDHLSGIHPISVGISRKNNDQFKDCIVFSYDGFLGYFSRN